MKSSTKYLKILFNYIFAIIRFLEKKMKIRRKAGSVVVIVLTLAAVVAACYGIIYVLVSEIIGFFTSAPDMWEKVVNSIQNVSDEVNKKYALLPKGSKDFFSKIGQNIYEALTDIGSSIGEKAADMA